MHTLTQKSYPTLLIAILAILIFVVIGSKNCNLYELAPYSALYDIPIAMSLMVFGYIGFLPSETINLVEVGHNCRRKK
jgi:hypothetical protein